MNNKISRIQIGMFLTLVCSSLYLGVSDIILLRKSENEVLIAMILGIILGLIPILMYLKINSCLPKLNIFEKNKILFGKILGTIINLLLILIYMVFLTISIRAVVIFVTSKYLQNTSFFFVGALVLITCFIICYKGIETIVRVNQLSFIATLILVILIEALLIKYIEIDNILPILTSKNYQHNILSGSIYYACSCGLLSMLFLTINKSKINEPKKFNKTIICFYLLSAISLTIVMFFIVSCFGYDMATLFRYPEYILLKKIGISNSELHLENLLAFRWIFYMLALSYISLYGLICGINSISKKQKLNKVIILILSILCVIGGKTAGNIPHSIIVIKNYYVPYIAGPMFIILTIIFIRCLFKKNTNKR